ncbi:sperm receptor for egg jelly-like [Oculina patagonica]
MMYIVLLLILALTCHGDGQQNCSSECSKALGMEDNRIKNSQIIGGFAYNGDYANFGSQNARLHNSRGFKANPTFPPSSNVIEIQFGEEMVVTAIATQGYASEWVTSFNLFYSDPLGNQQSVKDVNGEQLIFLGNTDSDTVKQNSLPIPVLASSVFILPLTVHQNVGLRMEFYGCKGGHYFIVWLMLKETFFTVAYTDTLNYEYQDAIANTLDEVNRILATTWGFLHAHVRELSPQKSPSLSTVVTAIVEIHCLRSSEQALLTKLNSVVENNNEGIFDPGFIKFQYPKRCKCPPPKATLKLSKRMKNAEELFLSKIFMRLPLQLEHSCPPTTAIVYSWKLSKIDKETGFFGPLLEWGRKKTFVLPLRMVGIGYAYIQCQVELSGEVGSMAFDHGYIRIVRDPLVAIITDTTESRTQIMLSAGKSYDAGRKWSGTKGLQFTWFCRLEDEAFLNITERYVVDEPFGRPKSDRGCFGFGPGRLTSEDDVLVLHVTEMVKSKKYIFKLVVNKGDRNASAVYEFAVKPLVTIFVRCLSNCGKKVSPQDRLLLEAFCQGEACGNISKYDWSLHLINQSGNDLSVSQVSHVKIYPQMNSQRLLINDISNLQDDTIRNIHYAAKAGVQLNDGEGFNGNFSFVVNSPPKRVAPDASCHVVPTEGEAISTDFLITCSGWHDADKPLTYEFRYQDKYGMVMIQVGSLNNVTTKLPVGEAAEDYALVLEALVGDSYKDFTGTRLLVKVRPPKLSDFNDGFVNKQLNVIRDLVQVGDADRATELAFMLMSTVKDFQDESFDSKSSAILHDMKGIKVKSVVHVTKVAAVVVWATENSQSVSLSLQADAFSLLSEATDFMASQSSSNSTHDAKVAKNASSVLLNSIGSLLRISSQDASVETKDDFRKESGRENTIKTLELVRKVSKVLSSKSPTNQRKTVINSNFVDIVIYKDKPEDLSGRNISEGGADLVIPDSKNIFPNTNESVTLQLMAFKDNPYTWDKTALSIRSTVIDVTLRTSEGVEVEINNLSKPLGLHIPNKHQDLEPKKQPRHLFLQPGVIRYHTLVIPSNEHRVSLRVKSVESQQLAVYFGLGFKPNANNYSSMVNLPDLSSCQNNSTDKLFNCNDDIHSANLIGYDPGLYYVGITLISPAARLRRSCTGTGRRRKRSCVEVKDPPTTPPPTPLIVTPQYNAKTDANYTFSVTMGACLYWSEKEEKWSSKGCKVGIPYNYLSK